MLLQLHHQLSSTEEYDVSLQLLVNRHQANSSCDSIFFLGLQSISCFQGAQVAWGGSKESRLTIMAECHDLVWRIEWSICWWSKSEFRICLIRQWDPLFFKHLFPADCFVRTAFRHSFYIDLLLILMNSGIRFQWLVYHFIYIYSFPSLNESLYPYILQMVVRFFAIHKYKLS